MLLIEGLFLPTNLRKLYVFIHWKVFTLYKCKVYLSAAIYLISYKCYKKECVVYDICQLFFIRKCNKQNTLCIENKCNILCGFFNKDLKYGHMIYNRCSYNVKYSKKLNAASIKIPFNIAFNNSNRNKKAD